MDWRALSLGGHNGLEGIVIWRLLWIKDLYEFPKAAILSKVFTRFAFEFIPTTTDSISRFH